MPGATTWKEEWAAALDAFETIYVVIEPDGGGDAMRSRMEASSLRSRVRLVRLQEAKDPAALYLQSGDEFLTRWSDALASSELVGPGPVVEAVASDRGDSWPAPAASEAFVGLAGELVELIEPHTEADRMALLTNLLVFTSSVVGRAPHLRVGATRHALNLFGALVGRSAKARKGDSLPPIEYVFKRAAPEWFQNCRASGLSSGEGLIQAVRDTAAATPASSNAADKRLLIIETEFGRVLRHTKREGILSPVIRNIWDGGTLSVLTRKDPMTATDAHVSILGHVTLEELRREMTAVEVANGFANRFLWVAVHRSKYLPDPQPLDDAAMQPSIERLSRCIDDARTFGRMVRDERATEWWTDGLYRELSDQGEAPGMAGTVLARAEAQVMRLAAVYAILAGSSKVRLPDLSAAVAFWRYVVASVGVIFGRTTGDAVAEVIAKALRAAPAGLTRTDITARVLGGNKAAPVVQAALDTLERTGLAHRRGTGGRPVELWFAGPAERRAA